MKSNPPKQQVVSQSVDAWPTVLITSGGTRAPIDDVRWIGNVSRGTFGAELARCALERGWRVIYLHAVGAAMPLEDLAYIAIGDALSAKPDELRAQHQQYQAMQHNIVSIPFQTFDDYKRELRAALQTGTVDAVFLAAAVSDYSPKSHVGKLSSTHDTMTLTMSRNQKVIQQVRSWSPKPIFQVGFKLLVGVSEAELFATAYESGIVNGSHLTVANDLSKIRSGERDILVVTPETGCIRMSNPCAAGKLFTFFERRFFVTHTNTHISKDIALAQQYPKEWRQIKQAIAELYEDGLLEEFYPNSQRYHGSVSIRTTDGFLITARASDKANLRDDDIVHVDAVNESDKQIMARSMGSQKPSMNAWLSSMIFASRPGVRVIVHTHHLIDDIAMTEFAETPGTIEYAESAVHTLAGGRSVNLRAHGHISVGSTVREVMDYVRAHAVRS